MTAKRISPTRARRARPGRITPAEADARRALILRVATKEYLAKGFRGANLNVVSRRCRVSKTTIYRLFESKEKLFYHIATASVPEFSYDLARALRKNRPFKAVVRNVVEVMVDSTSNKVANAVLRLAVAERNRFPSIGQMVMNVTFEMLRPLGEYLYANARAGALSEEAALRFAYHLMSMATGGFGPLTVDPATVFGDRTSWINGVTKAFIERFSRESIRR